MKNRSRGGIGSSGVIGALSGSGVVGVYEFSTNLSRIKRSTVGDLGIESYTILKWIISMILPKLGISYRVVLLKMIYRERTKDLVLILYSE